MKRQAVNPYLPSFEYVPDGEPHVFGNRVYLYGSHDRFDGADFCLNDYVCYSAPTDDLSDWRYEGVIFRKEQDPRNQNIPSDAPVPKPGFAAEASCQPEALNEPGMHAMFAPDVTRGPDGRYYLYYCLDTLPEIAVAVCGEPAGAYAFLGFVRHADGTALGRKSADPWQFDPGVFVDDDGQIYLFSGNAPITPGWCGDNHYSQVMRLEADMLTLREAPRRLLPDLRNSAGTGFEGHEFFEASSLRKIEGRYYLIDSSVRSHELCWAVSDRPDGGYRFGGTLVDIGDVFLNGRTEEQTLNCLGNTHGSVECIEGQWYVFYHRQTNRTQYSRQACAERISFRNGRFEQAEVSSCGMNGGPLAGRGRYGAYIACQLTRHGTNVMSMRREMGMEYPYFTQDGADTEPTPQAVFADAQTPRQFIANLRDGAEAGFKRFRCRHSRMVSLTLRGRACGRLDVYAGDALAGCVPVALDTHDWQPVDAKVPLPDGDQALRLRFVGEGRLDWLAFSLRDD